MVVIKLTNSFEKAGRQMGLRCAEHADEAGARACRGKVFRYSDETAEAVASGEKAC